jgi:hypothetical protein
VAGQANIEKLPEISVQRQVDWEIFYQKSLKIRSKSMGYEYFRADYVKKSRFTNSRIMAALKRVEGGLPAPEICRELCISTAIAL